MAAKKNKASATASTASDFPEFFIIRLERPSGTHFVVARAELSVNAATLTPALARELDASFAAVAGEQRMGVMSADQPGDEYKKWMLFQMSKAVIVRSPT